MNYSEIEEVDNNRVWTPYDIKNGRINIIDDNVDNYKKKNPTIIQKSVLPDENTNSISQSITNNKLSDLYFSKSNIEKIQLLIIMKVSEDSNCRFKINKQSEQELLIIMRSFYLQYSKNLDNNIKNQIKDLNEMVVEWSSNNIISNIEQYLNYKKVCSTLPMPLERAQLPTQKGTKTLEIKSFI
jgi:hypothetical protein